LFWQSWLNYIRLSFIHGLSWTLLEIKIPREIMKSPKAMELILNAFHNTRSGNMLDRFWKGFLRMWYSLEVVSIGGQIHFLIYIQAPFRDFVEAQIYAQYPGAEISEIEDYSKIISPEDLDSWKMWGVEFALIREEAYPIRTYPEFGLEAGKTKEEEKTDPLTSFLESLGSLKEGEQIWFQILIRAADKDWREKAQPIIDELQQKKRASGEAAEDFSKPILSPGQRDVLIAIERNISRLGYETGIRALYLARSEAYNAMRPVFLTGAMKQYSTQDMNGFKPGTTTGVDYFFKKTRETRRKKRMLSAYQQRSYFYIPYRRKPFVLNTEGLATIFHFPGRVAETPTLGRIEAKRGGPPIDLPI